MRIGDDHLAYHIACNVFRQGMECDAAARLIRRQLPNFLKAIADEVKQDFNTRAIEEHGYDVNKEAEWLRHYTHGQGTEQAGPNEPDCPCRGTADEWKCAYYASCGFCRAAQKAKEEEFGGA